MASPSNIDLSDPQQQAAYQAGQAAASDPANLGGGGQAGPAPADPNAWLDSQTAALDQQYSDVTSGSNPVLNPARVSAYNNAKNALISQYKTMVTQPKTAAQTADANANARRADAYAGSTALNAKTGAQNAATNATNAQTTAINDSNQNIINTLDANVAATQKELESVTAAMNAAHIVNQDQLAQWQAKYNVAKDSYDRSWAQYQDRVLQDQSFTQNVTSLANQAATNSLDAAKNFMPASYGQQYQTFNDAMIKGAGQLGGMQNLPPLPSAQETTPFNPYTISQDSIMGAAKALAAVSPTAQQIMSGASSGFTQPSGTPPAPDAGFTAQPPPPNTSIAMPSAPQIGPPQPIPAAVAAQGPGFQAPITPGEAQNQMGRGY